MSALQITHLIYAVAVTVLLPLLSFLSKLIQTIYINQHTIEILIVMITYSKNQKNFCNESPSASSNQ